MQSNTITLPRHILLTPTTATHTLHIYVAAEHSVANVQQQPIHSRYTTSTTAKPNPNTNHQTLQRFTLININLLSTYTHTYNCTTLHDKTHHVTAYTPAVDNIHLQQQLHYYIDATQTVHAHHCHISHTTAAAAHLLVNHQHPHSSLNTHKHLDTHVSLQQQFTH